MIRKSYGSKTVLVLYGGLNETHEVAFKDATTFSSLEGTGVQSQIKNGSLVLNWAVTAAEKVVSIQHDLTVYLIGKYILNPDSCSCSLLRAKTAMTLTTTGFSTSQPGIPSITSPHQVKPPLL